MGRRDSREPGAKKSVADEVRELPATIEATNSTSWGVWPRRIASVAILFHGLAVIAEPFHFFTRSPVRASAADARLLRSSIAPYVDFMFLSHGYFFFAPNPGPNHLIRCELVPEGPNAEPPDRLIIEFPDRKKHWPRLLYHRYFMLSEFYNNMFAPADLPPEAKTNSRARADWTADRERYTRLQTDIIRNLQSHYPNHSVMLRRVAHLQPSEEQFFQEHWKLTDPRLYTVLPETLEQLEASSNPSSSSIQPSSPATPAASDLGKEHRHDQSLKGELIPLGVPQGSQR